MAHDSDGPKKGEVRFENGRPKHVTEDDEDDADDSE